MTKISNEKIELSATIDLNDQNYLTDIIESEKNLSINMTIFLNESSNEKLYKKLLPIFNQIKDKHRELYELSFKNGWYTLEEAETKKIEEEYNCLNQKLQELSE